MRVELDDGRTVAIGSYPVQSMLLALLAIADELPEGGFKLTLDVGRDGAVRPSLQRSWPERKAPKPPMVN